MKKRKLILLKLSLLNMPEYAYINMNLNNAKF